MNTHLILLLFKFVEFIVRNVEFIIKKDLMIDEKVGTDILYLLWLSSVSIGEWMMWMPSSVVLHFKYHGFNEIRKIFCCIHNLSLLFYIINVYNHKTTYFLAVKTIILLATFTIYISLFHFCIARLRYCLVRTRTHILFRMFEYIIEFKYF